MLFVPLDVLAWIGTDWPQAPLFAQTEEFRHEGNGAVCLIGNAFHAFMQPVHFRVGDGIDRKIFEPVGEMLFKYPLVLACGFFVFGMF